MTAAAGRNARGLRAPALHGRHARASSPTLCVRATGDARVPTCPQSTPSFPLFRRPGAACCVVSSGLLPEVHCCQRSLPFHASRPSVFGRRVMLAALTLLLAVAHFAPSLAASATATASAAASLTQTRTPSASPTFVPGTVSEAYSSSAYGYGSNPNSPVVGAAGQVYFREGGCVRVLPSNGIVTVVVGWDGGGVPAAAAGGFLFPGESPSPTSSPLPYNPAYCQFGSSGDGGPGTSATIGYSGSLAVDTLGNVYLAETVYSTIRKWTTSTGIITTILGQPGITGVVVVDNVPAASALLNGPSMCSRRLVVKHFCRRCIQPLRAKAVRHHRLRDHGSWYLRPIYE